MVDADAPLMEAGVDSLGAVELRNQLQGAAGGAALPSTLVFDHPTARQLALVLVPKKEEGMLEVAASLHNLASTAAAGVAIGGTSALLPLGLTSVLTGGLAVA